MAGQLHELIAVETDAKAKAAKIMEEMLHLFSAKKEHFVGSVKTYAPFTEADKDLPENEIKPVVTTVAAKLKYALPSFAKLLDIIYQKEKTNCKASADIMVEGEAGGLKKLAADVPVTVLVQYEKQLVTLRSIFDAIPTLDPSFEWLKDEQRPDVYKTNPILRVRTKKIQKPIVLHEATEKFAAQVQLITDDVPVGQWTQVLSCGAISSADKSKLLSRVDELIEAVKRARAKANKEEAESSKIAEGLVKFILG